MGWDEVQMDSRMALQPTVLFRLVSIQVVQHDTQMALRVGAHDLIHEVRKLSSPPSVVMARTHAVMIAIRRGMLEV